MSKQQYNLTTKTDYLSRKMFLDPAGPVTIQRFEEVKYKKLNKQHVAFFGYPKKLVSAKTATILKMPAMQSNISLQVTCYAKQP